MIQTWACPPSRAQWLFIKDDGMYKGILNTGELKAEAAKPEV